MNKYLDFIIPRFVTEEVVFEFSEPDCAYIPMYPVDQLMPGEFPEQVGTIRSLSFFGMGWFPKLIGELHDYKPGEKNDK